MLFAKRASVHAGSGRFARPIERQHRRGETPPEIIPSWSRRTYLHCRCVWHRWFSQSVRAATLIVYRPPIAFGPSFDSHLLKPTSAPLCPLPLYSSLRHPLAQLSSIVSDPVPADQVQEVLASASNALVYLFDSFKIPQEVTVNIISLGYLDVEIWSKIEDSLEGVRAAIKSDLGIDPAKGAAHRRLVARLLACWETAHKKGQMPRRRKRQHNMSLASRGHFARHSTWNSGRRTPRHIALWKTGRVQHLRWWTPSWTKSRREKCSQKP